MLCNIFFLLQNLEKISGFFEILWIFVLFLFFCCFDFLGVFFRFFFVNIFFWFSNFKSYLHVLTILDFLCFSDFLKFNLDFLKFLGRLDFWIFFVTCDVTRDTWHVTCLGGVNIPSKFQLPSSYGLWFMILWISGGKGWLSDWMNQSMTRLFIEQPRLHRVC